MGHALVLTTVLRRRNGHENRSDDDGAAVVKRPPHEDAYSVRLAKVARFAVTHKWIVIGTWLGLAVVLATVFPQLETVVKQQALDPIPRDVASFRTLDRMGKAFGEEGSTTTVVVAMEIGKG